MNREIIYHVELLCKRFGGGWLMPVNFDQKNEYADK